MNDHKDEQEPTFHSEMATRLASIRNKAQAMTQAIEQELSALDTHFRLYPHDKYLKFEKLQDAINSNQTTLRLCVLSAARLQEWYLNKTKKEMEGDDR